MKMITDLNIDSLQCGNINTILKTKLYAPYPKSNIVSRARLLKQLSLSSECKLTLISAPAGYGKTTLVSEWVRKLSIPFTWLSFDSSDNDPLTFINYVSEALKELDINLGNTGFEANGLGIVQSAQQLVNVLINNIIQKNSSFIFVMDDYHSITDERVHKIMQYLLDFQPECMHIVLLTRKNPPLSIAKLRASSQLVEISSKDLCFNLKETEEFFHRTMKLNIDKPEIKLLSDHTEGWAAALQLAGLSIQGLVSRGSSLRSLKSFIVNFNGSNNYITNFLMEEVLSQLDINIKEFLCKTSILNRFTPSLCDAVIERDDSRAVLQYLYKANLFLIPIDDNGQWFRYHHLLSELLQSEIDEQSKKHIFLKAAHWMDDHGFRIEAVKYAIASKDIDTAEKTIERAAEYTFSKYENTTLLNWIEFLPKERVQSNLVLSLYKAWCLFLEGEIEDSLNCVAAIEENFVLAENPEINGKVLSLKSGIYMILNKVEALDIAKQALKLISDRSSYSYVLALHALAHSYNLIGDVEKAVDIFKKALVITQKNNLIIQVICTSFHILIGLYKLGRLKEAEQLCLNILKCYEESSAKQQPIHALYLILGILSYEKDDLNNALTYLQQGAKLCAQFNLTYWLGEAVCYLARVQYALGNVKDAFNTITEWKHKAEHVKCEKLIDLLCSLEADLYLMENYTYKASKCLKEEQLSIVFFISPYAEAKYFTYARILIAEKRYDEALALLLELEESAVSYNRFGGLITIGVLKAKTYKMLGNINEAQNSLQNSITYAAPENIYRRFLDEGEEIFDLLSSAAAINPDFTGTLTSKYKNLKAVDSFINSTPLLSDREVEILQLLVIRFSQKDIANKLHIAVPTVKWHINNIYSKLGVNKRSEAVDKAMKLSLI